MHRTTKTERMKMKKLFFFFALIGLILSVDAGTRIDVDIGEQVLTENVLTIEIPETPMLQVECNMVMPEVSGLEDQHPGELSSISVNMDQDGAKLYKTIPEGPGTEAQGVNIDMDELSVNRYDRNEAMARIYHYGYLPTIESRNDLKRNGAATLYRPSGFSPSSI